MTIDAERRAAAIRDYVGGESSTTVAARYGVTSTSVLGWVRQASNRRRAAERTPAAKPAEKYPVEALPLREGPLRALRRGGYKTVGQVAAATDEELLGVRYLGEAKLVQIRAAVAAFEPPAPKPPPRKLTAENRYYAELAARGLLSSDLVTIEEAWEMYRADLKPRQAMTELAERVGTPAPAPLFIVGRRRWWLYDDVFAWLAPVYARRWERAYEARRKDVERRWARVHSVRRPPPGVANRWGYQGVRRLDDSIPSKRRWGASLGYQGRSWMLGYRATPEEAGRLYDRGLIAIGERPVNFPDDVATTMLLPGPHVGPKTSVTAVLLQIIEKHGPIETGAMLDLLPSWPVQPTRPTTRDKALSIFTGNAVKQRQAVLYVKGGWVLAGRAGDYSPARPPGGRYDDATKERVLRSIRDGISIVDAASTHDISRYTVRIWASKAGIRSPSTHERPTARRRPSSTTSLSS